MRTQSALYLAAAILLAAFIPDKGFAQSPPNPAIRVVSSGSSGGYHFKIRTFNSETTWSDINNNTMDSDDTEESFFPLGWYFDPYPTTTPGQTLMDHLEKAANHGATVVLPYDYTLLRILTHDDPIDLNNYTSTQYKQGIELFLTTLQQFNTTHNKNIKAIISLRPYSYASSYNNSSSNYSQTQLQALLQYFKGNPNIFAWYTADEPDLTGTVTPSSLLGVQNIVQLHDPTHLTYAVFGDPKTFGPMFSTSSCDIPGADPYVFSPAMDYNTFDVHDFNFIGSKTYTVDNKVRSANKAGSIMVVQGQDASPYSHNLMNSDIMYQTLSPIIHGARGLLYWQYSTSPWTSTDLVNRSNSALDFLTSSQNRKKTSLVDVLMKGTDKTASTHLSNITIDGQSTFVVNNTPVTFNNENDLKTYYTYFRFNDLENVGNVYKLNGSSWQQTALNFPSDFTRTHILQLYSTATNTIFASSSGCSRIQKTTAGSTSWSATDPYCSPASIRAFATLPNGTVIGAGNHRLYSYNAGTNLWSESSIIQVGSQPASTVTSLLVKDSIIFVGTAERTGVAGIYRSMNNGVTWQLLSSSVLKRQLYTTLFENEPIHSLTIDNSGNIYAGGLQGHIFKSSDNGNTWTIASQWQEGISSVLPNYAVWSLEYINNALYAGTSNGLYKSTNGGTSWSKISGMPTRTTVWDMAFNSSYIYAATNNGVYRINLSGTQSASLFNGSSGDLYTQYNTPTSHVECRTITIDNGGNVYVGTLENHDAFANKQDQAGQFWAVHENFPMFNYTVKKHNNSYYIFAVNDFRPTLNVNFVLNSVLDNNETALHVSELLMDGSEVQHNTSALQDEGLPNGVPKLGFSASFGAYQARVFRIDVFKWSNISAINRECNGVAPNQDPCKTHAGGVTIADFDGDGKKDDFMVMWVPELSGEAIEPFRFKIGWNIQNPSDGIIAFDASNPTALTNFSPSTGNCYGEIPGVSTNVDGGDITNDNLAGWTYGNGQPMPDVFFMGIDPASSTYRTKIGWDIRTAIPNQPVSQLLYTHYSGNFPPLGGQFTMPTPVPATGGGITTYYKQTDSVNSLGKPVPNSKPEVILGHLADEPTANMFHYTTSRDWSIVSNAWSPLSYTVPTTGDTRHPVGDEPGWDTEGSGMDIGQLYPLSQDIVGLVDKYHEMAFGAIDATQEFRYIIHNFDPAIGELDGVWRPAMTLPIRPSWYTGTVKDAGIALGDIDGDGDDDMIIMAIAQDCHGESPSQIFVRFGINTLFNEPASYKKQAEITEQQPRQPMTGERVATTLSNRPNPFNTTTSVHYSIDKPAHIELEVYSMLGEVVYRMDAGVQQPGEYQMPFDAGTLSNGIYMCRLKANGVTVNAVKMVIAR